MIARRTLLAGGIASGAAALLASRGVAVAPEPIATALDEAAMLPPADALRRIAGYDPAALSPSRRLDLLTARAGLAIDLALADRPDDYALRLSRTLGDIAPDVAQARIAGELATLLARADQAFTRMGMTGPSVGARYGQLFADPRFHYLDCDAGRDAAVADMNATLAVIRRRALLEIEAPHFAFDAAARRLSDAEVLAGKGGYRVVPEPGRAGAYIVDLKEIARRPRWSLPSVVAHELIPGHMLQLGIEAVDPPHPLRLVYAAALVEGWGVYAETLASEWGLFTAPLEELGHLHWLMFRAARGLVDINIHRHGWSVDRARAALEGWQGVPAYFAPFDSDLARIVKEPGTRAAEAMAWLAIADRAPRTALARRTYSHALLVHGRKRTEDLP